MSASQLQSELRQRKPFRSSAHEATLAIYRTSDLLSRCSAGIIEPRGLSGEQYNVLRILRGAAPEGLPTLEVAERMVVRSPAITRLLDKLEAKRLVERRRCDRDRRRVYCAITASGLNLLESLDKPVDGVADTVLSAVSASDLLLLIRVLERIRASATKYLSETSEGKRNKRSPKENL